MGLRRPRTWCARAASGPGEMIAAGPADRRAARERATSTTSKARAPVKRWLKQGVRYLDSDLIDPRSRPSRWIRRHAGALPEDVQPHARGARTRSSRVLAETESEAVGSMGDDTPMAVLSHKVALAVRLLPPAVRAGHQPADRSAARAHRDVAADADRAGVQHLRAGARARDAGHDELAGAVAAQAAPDRWRWPITA